MKHSSEKANDSDQLRTTKQQMMRIQENHVSKNTEQHLGEVFLETHLFRFGPFAITPVDQEYLDDCPNTQTTKQYERAYGTNSQQMTHTPTHHAYQLGVA